MQRLGAFFARLAQRHLPDPLALAGVLTLAVGLAVLLFPNREALREATWSARGAEIVRIWLAGVWNPAFLEFALQMCVVLLTGFGLARAPAALRGLRRLAAWPSTNRGAVGLIALTSCAGCWINWGFGLILAGVLAVEMRTALARRGVACQYPLIVAAAYAGMMIWHGGLSGSAPLKVAESGVSIASAHDGAGAAQRIAPITVEQTVLSGANLCLSVGLIAGIPLLLRALAARNLDASEVVGSVSLKAIDAGEAPPMVDSTGRGLADRLNHARALTVSLALLVLAGVAVQVFDRVRVTDQSLGLAALQTLNLNVVNSLFLALGLLLHPNIASYVAAVTDGGRAIVGIVIQFPLYGGIQALMVGGGLALWLSQSFVQIAQWTASTVGVPVDVTFPIATLLSAGAVNFFIPSGGGQWIVQGPIMCAAAGALGLPPAQTVMAVAYGDQLTNMVQPFWAIPLMGLTRVDARAFMGYCALLMLLATPVFALALLLY